MLKKTNKAIATKLMSLKPKEKVLELLTILGYVDMDTDFTAFVGEFYGGLVQGSRMIDDQSMELKMLTMNEEDRKKQERII